MKNFCSVIFFYVSTIFSRLFSHCKLTLISIISQNTQPQERELQFDALFATDLCKNGPGPDDVGSCDMSRFPICQPGETRCYNRKVWRDKFHVDIKQPMTYIDYDSVLCYPDGFRRACSSCSPGRYCESEGRCILDEIDYNCTQWL